MFYGEKIEAIAEKFLDLWPVTASNSTKYEKTIKLLADMAGVSLSEFYQADYIEHEGDKRTRIRTMIGEISIQEVYRSLTNPLEPDAEALKDAPNDSVVENKYRVKPIREQVEHLASRVNDGDASPKAIVAELSRLAELIDDVGA